MANEKALALFLILFGLAACSFKGPSLKATSEQEAPLASTQTISSSAKASWEQKWESTINEARKEGRVIYSSWFWS